jgi:hypothetical protein
MEHREYTDNILAVYNNATPEAVAEGAQWYRIAHEQCYSAAIECNANTSLFCGAVAILSPTMRWQYNIAAAVSVFAGSGSTHGALGRNVAKAKQLVATGNTTLITGPKVTAFYHTLLDPAHPIPVIDRWAVRAAGHMVTSNGIGPVVWRALVAAYQNAAGAAGIMVSEMQAITWVAQRSLS